MLKDLSRGSVEPTLAGADGFERTLLVLPSPVLKVAVKLAEILNNVRAEIGLELFVKEQLCTCCNH